MPATDPAPVRTVIVGVDGSANSRAAVQWAARLAVGLGAKVVAVHALGLLERLDPGGGPTPAEAHLAEIDERFASEWCRPLVDGGVEHRRELRYGPPVQVLLDAAEKEDADLVVVGSRGCGGSSARLLGSTSSRLANSSSRPVCIVPAPDGPA